LAAFILGLSAGSFAVARVVDRWRRPAFVIGVVQVMIGVAALLILPIYAQLPSVVFKLTRAYGASAYALLLTFEFLIVIGVTFVPTFLMGAMFPIVTRAIARHADDRAAAVGRAYGINTIGTILGSGLAGFVFLDWLGVQYSIAVASVLNASAGAALLYHARAHIDHPGQRAIPPVLSLAGVTLLALVVSVGLRWNPLISSSGPFIGRVDPAQSAEAYELEFVDEGVDLTVMVAHAKHDPDERILTVNGKADASTHEKDMLTQLVIGHMPALLPPKTDRVCVIGLGCGMTVAAVLQHPQVKALDCIEISDEVISAAAYFSDFCDNVLEDDKRLNLMRADGRNHLLLTDQTYDLIISQPSNPWITGVSNLFTVEFFELCDARLAEDGVVCVWMQSYGMAPADFQMIVRTVSSVFGYVSIWGVGEQNFALIAGQRPFQTPLSTILARFHQPDVWADLYRMGLGRPEALLGRMYSDGDALRQWAVEGPLNTDDNALLEFSAPRHIYRDPESVILGEVLAIRQSPFERAIRVDQPDDPVSSGVVNGVARVRAAQLKQAESATAFVAAREARKHGAHVQADRFTAQGLDLLVQSYQLDPTSVPVYFDLVDFEAQLQQVPDLANNQALVARLNQFKSLAPPVCSTRKNPSLEKLVVTLRRDIKKSEQSAQWLRVAGYGDELLRLTPQDGNTLIRVSRALVRLGENAAAAAVLKSAIERQVIAVDQVREHEVNAELAGIDEIRAVLEAAGA
jgi:spermidine synthase